MCRTVRCIFSASSGNGQTTPWIYHSTRPSYNEQYWRISWPCPEILWKVSKPSPLAVCLQDKHGDLAQGIHFSHTLPLLCLPQWMYQIHLFIHRILVHCGRWYACRKWVWTCLSLVLSISWRSITDGSNCINTEVHHIIINTGYT